MSAVIPCHTLSMCFLRREAFALRATMEGVESGVFSPATDVDRNCSLLKHSIRICHENSPSPSTHKKMTSHHINKTNIPSTRHSSTIQNAQKPPPNSPVDPLASPLFSPSSAVVFGFWLQSTCSGKSTCGGRRANAGSWELGWLVLGLVASWSTDWSTEISSGTKNSGQQKAFIPKTWLLHSTSQVVDRLGCLVLALPDSIPIATLFFFLVALCGFVSSMRRQLAGTHPCCKSSPIALLDPSVKYFTILHQR